MAVKAQWDSKKIDPKSRERRRRLWMATLVTCVAGAFLGGVFHTLFLAKGRVGEMQAHSTYDAKAPSEVAKHVQAAGEFIDAATRGQNVSIYSVAGAEGLLSDALWKQLGQRVEVPAGPFIMGTDRPESDIQDRPRHTVTTGAYRINKFPVTNAQYALFVAETGHKAPTSWKDGAIPKGFNLHPVTNVDWQDATDYCVWSDKGGALPTEAQWEKAARGTDGRRWPWGDRMSPKMLNTYNNYGRTTSVLKHMDGASPYGAVDMAGNVSEWVKNDFKPYPGSSAPASMFIPKDTEGSYKTLEHYKALRGGSWKSDPFSTATYHRNYAMAGDASDFIGFRCAFPANAGKGKKE